MKKNLQQVKDSYSEMSKRKKLFFLYLEKKSWLIKLSVSSISVWNSRVCADSYKKDNNIIVKNKWSKRPVLLCRIKISSTRI